MIVIDLIFPSNGIGPKRHLYKEIGETEGIFRRFFFQSFNRIFLQPLRYCFNTNSEDYT